MRDVTEVHGWNGQLQLRIHCRLNIAKHGKSMAYVFTCLFFVRSCVILLRFSNLDLRFYLPSTWGFMVAALRTIQYVVQIPGRINNFSSILVPFEALRFDFHLLCFSVSRFFAATICFSLSPVRCDFTGWLCEYLSFRNAARCSFHKFIEFKIKVWTQINLNINRFGCGAAALFYQPFLAAFSLRSGLSQLYSETAFPGHLLHFKNDLPIVYGMSNARLSCDRMSYAVRLLRSTRVMQQIQSQ